MPTGTSRSRPRSTDTRARAQRRGSQLPGGASAALLPMLGLLGCAAADPSAREPGWVPPGEERVAFVGDARAAAQLAVRFDDGTEIEEYGRVAAGGWRAEYLYVAADADDTALQASFDVERATRLFLHNSGGTLVLGALGRVERADGTVLFRPFARPGEACFGFEGDLARGALDPLGRVSQLLLGYACRDGSQPPSLEAVAAFLDGVAPRRAATPDHIVALPSEPGALDFAAGRDQPGSGLFGYPLELARHYVVADAELR